MKKEKTALAPLKRLCYDKKKEKEGCRICESYLFAMVTLIMSWTA